MSCFSFEASVFVNGFNIVEIWQEVWVWKYFWTTLEDPDTRKYHAPQKHLTVEHDGPLHAAVFPKIIAPEEATPQLIWSPVTWSQLEADVNKLEHGIMQ